MKSSDLDKLTDALIGEAVLSMLKERGPLTISALIERLWSIKTHEKDPRRRELLARVITDIGENRVALKRRKAAHGTTDGEGSLRINRNNVVPLFGDGKPSNPKKIH
jgi:hypothetical protein